MANSTISDKDLDHYQLVMAFENYHGETLDPLVLSSLVDYYSPRVLASFNLASDIPAVIVEYNQCVTMPTPKPYYNKPTVNSKFPPRSPHHGIIKPKSSSPLPLQITAHRNDDDGRRYDIVSARSSFKKIGMNNEDYVVVVQKFGSTILLRRYDDKKNVDMSDEGHRFERMCTPDYHLDASYYQLIEGHIGTLTTLIKAETDAVSTENGKAIELKCRLNQNNIRDPPTCWLQAFLGGVDTVVVGERSKGEPPQLRSIQEYAVSTMIDDQAKNTILEHLYRVLRFLQLNVKQNATYLFSRRVDRRSRKHGLYLYKVDKRDETHLKFIWQWMLNQLAVNNQSGTEQESDVKQVESADAKRQANEFLDKVSVIHDTLTNYPSRQFDKQVQEGEVKYPPGPSASHHQMSSNRHATAADTGSHRIENITTNNGNEMDIAENYQCLEYSYNDDDDDEKSSFDDDIDDILEAKEIEECYLSEIDRSKKKKEESAHSRRPRND